MVPLYQRKYQWHDTQLIPFWEDVEAKAIEVLEPVTRHFFKRAQRQTRKA